MQSYAFCDEQVTGGILVLGARQTIKQKRLELKMTQRDLAHKLRVSVDAVRDWENEWHEPCGRNVKRIEGYLKG